MRLNLAGGVLAALLLMALLIGYASVFTVYQTDQVLVVRLGEPLRVVTEPGLGPSWPSCYPRDCALHRLPARGYRCNICEE